MSKFVVPYCKSYVKGLSPSVSRGGIPDLRRPLRAATCGIYILLLASESASAKPEFEQFFRNSIKPASGTALSTALCGTCHAGAPPVLNPYGSSLQAALRASQSKTLTDSILAQVAKLDSDKDGIANGKEVAAGTLPGNSASRPVGTGRPAENSASSGAASLVPMHSFHPLIVHFPVALLLFGAILEVVGARKSKPELRFAGFLNISVAAIASIGAVATGLTALFRLGMPLSGVPLLHLMVGSTATIAMLLVAGVGIRESKRGRNSRLYWGLLGFAFLAVAAAGHFGSVLVFG